MTELTIIDELKTLLPPLSSEEFTGLEADILEHGCLSPMIAWNGVLVDGHHRYEICTKHEIPFSVQNIVFDNIDAAKLWAWKHQEHRRNLTPFHRAELALKLKDTIASKAKERQGQRNDRISGNIPATLPECNGYSVPAMLPEAKETRQELAELAGIGSRTLDKAEYIAENADEETKEKLRRGEKGTSINKEYKRLKEEKQETSATDSEPTHSASTGETTTQESDSQPYHPNKHVKFVPHTTLKLIPQDSPRILLVNLLEIFRKGFVEEMVVMAMEMLLEERGKDTVKQILAELNKKYGRKCK